MYFKWTEKNSSGILRLSIMPTQLRTLLTFGLLSTLLTPGVLAQEPSAHFTLVDPTCANNRQKNTQISVEAWLGTPTTFDCISVNEPEAQRLIEKTAATLLPLVIFDSRIEDHPAFAELSRRYWMTSFYDKEQRYWRVSELSLAITPGLFLLNRERKPGEIAIFSMFNCPYVPMARKKINEYIKHNPNAGFSVKTRFIVTNIPSMGGIISPFGPEALEEDLRQVILQEDYPELYPEYLELRKEHSFKKALAKLDIKPKKIDRQKDRALELLAKDARDVKRFDITGSPTFMWENQYLIYVIEGLGYQDALSGLLLDARARARCEEEGMDPMPPESAAPGTGCSPCTSCVGGTVPSDS